MKLVPSQKYRLAGVYRLKNGNGYVMAINSKPGGKVLCYRVDIMLAPERALVVEEADLEEISAEEPVD